MYALVLSLLLAEPPEAAIRHQIEAVLPPDLKLVAIELPKKALRDPTVEWVRPPVAGRHSVAVRSAGSTERSWVAIRLESSTAGLPPIARGTPVTVRVVRGAVELEAEGVLDRTVKIGDIARVRLEPNRFVQGRLADAHTVLVEGVTR